MAKTPVLPKFPVTKDSLHAELRKNVQAYFAENNIKQQGNFSLYFKAGLLMVAFVGLYLHLLLGAMPWWLAVLECLLLGLVVSMIGFNIMHDGNHGSFSTSKTWNKLAAYSGSVMGASQFMWEMKHNIIHHSFTNIEGVDDDIEAGSLLRLAPTQDYRKIHRFQHIYFVLLYMQMYLFWIFFSDYRKYFTKKIGDIPLKKMTFGFHLRFWGMKIAHAAIFVVIPIMVLGWQPWLLGFLIMSLMGGFFLSIVFQLAHTVEDASFPLPAADTNKLEQEFALHQLATTANFATKNKIWTWMLGGLNFQIEHHLFPKIAHIHYPKISKIIKETCAKHNIPYIEYRNVRTAVKAHVTFLKRMGQRPVAVA